MGGKREWWIRSTTVAALLVFLSAHYCNATIYRINSDEIIDDDDDDDEDDDDDPPRTSSEWQNPGREQSWSRFKENTYQNRETSWTELQEELPDGWKMALRRTAFQSLRQEAGILFGYSGVTPSIQDNLNRELWYRLSVAEFIGTREYQDYDEEELQSDISTLAEGLLIHKDGELQFYIVNSHSSCDCEGVRTLATWSIRRLRHSGPGRGRPQYQLHFSVIPITEDRSVDLVPVRVEPVERSPSPKYRGIPIYTRSGHKEYNPRFVAEYGQVISAFLQHRDRALKNHQMKDSRSRIQNQYRKSFEIPEQQPSEEFDDDYREHYIKDDPQEEYRNYYRRGQQHSRSQYNRYYREKYSNYQLPRGTNSQYQQNDNYKKESSIFTDFPESDSEIKEFHPSPSYERYSEIDPVLTDDQRPVSQVLVAQRGLISQVPLITTRAIQEIPVLNGYKKQWLSEDYKTQHSSYKLDIVKENNHSVEEDSLRDWSKRAISERSQERTEAKGFGIKNER